MHWRILSGGALAMRFPRHIGVGQRLVAGLGACGQAARRTRVEPGGEHDPAPATPLGFIQGAVRAAKQLVPGGSPTILALADLRNADAGAGEPAKLVGQRDGADATQDAVGQQEGLGFGGMRAKHAELFTAVAARKVRAAVRFLQDAADLLQDAVAGAVAAAVVDVLEAVDVDHQAGSADGRGG